MRRVYKSICISISLAALAPSMAPAKIDLVTLPAPDRTELTIYNSQDLTLVRETRTLSFKPGENRIQFAWADTKIDPTSLKLNTDRSPALTLEETIYPANTKDLAVWVVRATEPASVPVDISYFSAGLTWKASYEVRANADETTFRMQQFTRLTNASGQDFENVNARAVVGEVRLIELIATLADSMLGKPFASDKQQWDFDMDGERDFRNRDFRTVGLFAMEGERKKVKTNARQIIKQAVSEYYLFAIEGETDLKDGWAQSMPNPPVADVPFDLSYEHDPRRYGPRPVKFYKLRNDGAHKLDKDPLPAGTWQVVRDDGRGGIALEGRADHKYVPKGEKVELNLGADGLVIAEEKLLSSRREKISFRKDGDVGGWDDVDEIEIDLRNSRDRAVPLKFTRYFTGDWELADASIKGFERVDKTTLRWELDLPAASKTTLRLTVRTHRGDNAKAL